MVSENDPQFLDCLSRSDVYIYLFGMCVYDYQKHLSQEWPCEIQV